MKPLFGFYGTRDQCDRKITNYIYYTLKSPTVMDENVTTIYQISCLDPSVPKTYVGKSLHFYSDRIRDHIDSSCVDNRLVYTYIREHGWWKNWVIQPLGHYLCDGDDGNRLEWFWWKKLGCQLNKQTPGKEVMKRDKMKLNLSDDELFKLYEQFEERINREYTGSEPPPIFSKKVTISLLDIDCCPSSGDTEDDESTTQKKKKYKCRRNVTGTPKPYTRYRYSRAVYQIFSEPDDYAPAQDYTGSLYHIKNENDSESYLGFTVRPEYTQETFTLDHLVSALTSTRKGKFTYLYMSRKGGGLTNWTWNFVTNKCLHSDYKKLSSYFVLNNLTHDKLKIML